MELSRDITHIEKKLKTEKQMQNTVNEIADIMHKNCSLAAQKWNRPAISLSGGMDSKTTLSVANGLYDKFFLYSFQSKDTEEVDAKVANEICKEIDL